MRKEMARADRRRTEAGVSLLELIVVVVIVGIVSAFTVSSIRKSRDSLALQNSVRQLAGYIEKARLDAVRRHDTSSVTFTSNTSYDVRMDFDGRGTPAVYTRTFSLEPGVAKPPGPLPTISFNWRGRTSACTNTIAFQNAGGLQSWVDVSDAGDVTVNGDVGVLPSVSYATVSTTAGIAPVTVVSGSNTHINTLDCDTSVSGAAGPPVTGTGPGGCTLSIDPSSATIRKSGGSSTNIVLASNTSGTVTASGPVNLTISPASQPISAHGSVTFSVTSNNRTRGSFAVNFSSACTTVTTIIKIVN
jgi:prepilin-type N-terminal cleavage/methylation domain-containing protein